MFTMKASKAMAMNFLEISFVAGIMLLSSVSTYAQSGSITTNQNFSFGKINAGLNELDQAIGPKWNQFKDWQTKESWINEQARLGIVGSVYEKGFIGSSVSRNIIPDQQSGYLVVDRVQIHAGPLLQVGNLAGNIFFQHIFPYVQVGADISRTYVNVRKVQTYKEGLLSSPFQFSKMPATSEKLALLKPNEIVSTVTSGGVFARAGAGILSLMGVTLASSVDFGPRAKIYMNRNFKVSIVKHNADEVLVLVENALESGLGIGLSTGVYIDNLIDSPIAIGINQADGYSPIRLNYKVSRENIRAILYKINFKSKAGAYAYDQLMKRDLTAMDDLAEKNNSSVVREMVKEGVVHTSEFNVGVDLIFYRSGFRNIFVEAAYQTNFRKGQTYKYKEFSSQKIDESFWWWGDHHNSEKYTAYVAVNENKRDGFVLDSRFDFTDTDTNANELKGMIAKLQSTINHLPVSVNIDPEKKYGAVKIVMTVRFPAKAIAKILKTKEAVLWNALANSSGFSDGQTWGKSNQRNEFIDENKPFDPFSASALQNAAYLTKKQKHELYQESLYIRDFMRELRVIKNSEVQAKKLVEFLKTPGVGLKLHRAMIDMVGRDQLMIRGQLRGGNTR